MGQYLFTFVNHLLDNTFKPFELGTHARASTDRRDGLVQVCGLIRVRHQPFFDSRLPLLLSIDFEL